MSFCSPSLFFFEKSFLLLLSFISGPHPAVLRTYFWLSVQRLLLAGLRRPYGARNQTQDSCVQRVSYPLFCCSSLRVMPFFGGGMGHAQWSSVLFPGSALMNQSYLVEFRGSYGICLDQTQISHIQGKHPTLLFLQPC